MSYHVIVRDTDRTRIGVLPVLGYTMVAKDNDVGTWQLTIDANSDKADLIQPGRGILFIPTEAGLSGDPEMSGPITVIDQQADEQGKRTLSVSGLDDNVHLQDRLIYPDPSRTFEQQTIVIEADAAAYDVRSGPGETVLKQLVDLNAGPGAVVARRVPGLTVQTDLALGADVDSSSRFDVLLVQLAALAKTAVLSFRVVQVGTGLQFQVWEPRDRTAQARFSRRLGNLGAYGHRLEAPKVTASGVAGSGTLEERAMIERVDTAAQAEWGRRVEGFLDQPSTDVATELEQAGDRNNADNGTTGALTMAPRDIPSLRFGVDYRLGDVVTVETDEGPVMDRVRSVTITGTPDGSTTAPLVGSDGASAEPADVRRIRNLTQRIAQRETRS